jgi:hypothetical protein
VPAGYLTSFVGTTIEELVPGTTYWFRLRATNAVGETITPAMQIATLTEPTAITNEATEIGPTVARFNGTVNAGGFSTSAVFEWGINGSSFPNRLNALPSPLTGTADATVSAPIAGLSKGRTYFYRLRAMNAAGVVIGGTQSFTTLTEPIAVTGGAFALTTTTARVSGLVNPQNSTTEVEFEYGTDGVSFPNSTTGAPTALVGNSLQETSAVLSNLLQGVTYFYRVKATSGGGFVTSTPGSFSMGVLSGFAQQMPGALPSADGFLLVNLLPAGINSGWRFVGEQQWRPAGVPVGGLATGNRQIEFRPVPGYLHPLREPVSVVSGQPATVVEREYYSGAGSTPASLSVTLLPAGLGDTVQWRLLGEDDTMWRFSGAMLGGLAPGVYLVEFRDIAGYTTPRPLTVPLLAGETKSAAATYFLADAQVGAQPSVIGFDLVTAQAPNAYTYVGQLRSDSGAGTGFVVRQRVVATAAHVVFDDGTLTAATGLQWLFQREQGTYEPVPQAPRGSYILSGYSAQRAADNNPGTSSAASQNLDVAVVWFFEEDAGRGGFGGYLASDSLVNEWLISDRLKTLVGYPLDDISLANQGRIHATPVLNVAFSPANDRVYLTDDITSQGGNSGGPVCVQYDDGKYYPAAVYLGGTTQTRVRAIDSDVIRLFDSAEESSNTGQNSTNGGVPQVNASASVPASGTLTVTLNPPEVRNAGAGWRIGSGAFQSSGQSQSFLSSGSYQLSFRSVAGYRTPTVRNADVSGGGTTAVTVSYLAARPPVITGPAVVRVIRGQPVSFAMAADNEPTLFSASGLAGTGLSINSGTGEVTGTATDNGTYALTVTASNETGTSTPFTLSIIVADPGSLSVQADPTRGNVIVKPKRDGNIFPQGERVTLIAEPKSPDFVFAGWEFSGLDAPADTITETKTTFTMASSVIATARFVPNPFPTRSGVYHSLLTNIDGFPDGILSLKISSNGKFTLTLTIGGVRYRLKNQINGDGVFIGQIAREGVGPIDVALTLDLNAAEPQVSGTLVVDGATIQLSGQRAAGKRGIPAVEAGTHTLIMPPDSTKTDATVYPLGHGYAVVKVRSTGAVQAVGKLGDGTAFSVGGAVMADHRWPVYLQPYQKQGLLGGNLTFTSGDADRIDGQLLWRKPAGARGLYPAGFEGTIATDGSRFEAVKNQPVLPINSWNLRLGDGVLTEPVSAKVTLNPRNQFSVEGRPQDAIALSLDPRNGTLTGDFRDAAGDKISFRAILLQSHQKARGLIDLPNLTAPLALDPPSGE